MKKIIFFVISFVFFAFVSFNASTDVNAYSNSLFEDNEVVGVENEDQNVEITSDGDSPDEGDENWYDIPVINGVPTLEHSVDYSVTPELLKYIEPGDILYETNTNSGVVMHMALVCDILYSSEFNQYYIVVIVVHVILWDCSKFVQLKWTNSPENFPKTYYFYAYRCLTLRGHMFVAGVV